MDRLDATTGDDLATLAGDDAASQPARGDVEERKRGDTIGRYVVLARLDRGGMGVVYPAIVTAVDGWLATPAGSQ